MKEVDWLAGDLNAMLRYTRLKATKRKYRLVGVALVNRLRHLFPDPAFGRAVDATEQFADGKIVEPALKLAKAPILPLLQFGRQRAQATLAAGELAKPKNFHTCFALAAHAEEVDSAMRLKLSWPDARDDRKRAWLELIRDIFSNPFRPVPFDPAWRSDTAVSLARHIYESRDFSAMPILADALQDAGCEHADILTHCRGKGPHVRGCWVVDLVLEKS